MATVRPATFGARVRHARLAANLSQLEFANAISHIAKSRTSKSLISQWESDKVKSPANATVLAITAITGFAQQWLINGRGPDRAELPPLKAASRDTESRGLLRRAIIIACSMQTTPDAIADAAIEVFETLSDEPGAPEGALKRIARLSTVKR
jgi:transcriptional regulator with XRE-family HTH domain